MSLDELIAHLQAVREQHGGSHQMMLGQMTPGRANIWSGVPLQASMVRVSITEAGFASVPGYGHKAGWVWFEVPEGGIQHRQPNS